GKALVVGQAAEAHLSDGCGSPAAEQTASQTRTAAPTETNVFKADLRASNEDPPITDAESTCSGTAMVTFTSTSAKCDVSITGCPASTVINIGHIHEGAAGVNGGVKIDSTLKAGDITLSNGAVTFSRTNSAADPALITA